MTVTQHETSIYYNCRVAIRIEGADPLPNQYASGMFAPEGIILVYSKPNGEGWRFEQVKVHGPKIKAGGGRSSVKGRRDWHANDLVPSWLNEYVQKTGPPTKQYGLAIPNRRHRHALSHQQCTDRAGQHLSSGL